MSYGDDYNVDAAQEKFFARLSREQGVPIADHISASVLRRCLREVLARTEFDGRRWTLTRQGKPLAAILPMADLTRLQDFEREGIRIHRASQSLRAELWKLQARLSEAERR